MKKACRPLPCSWIAVFLLLAGSAAWAQLQINSSPNVVGSGARALGMGAAFIAVADDATAASWNPGGLTQLERPEFSIVYDFDWFDESYDAPFHPEFDSDHSIHFDGINYISFVYPVRRTFAGRNLVFSLNYQRQYDFDRDLKVRLNNYAALPGGNLAASFGRADYSQRGMLATLSPAIGFELSDKLSVGMTVNIWDQDLLPDNEWKVRQTDRMATTLNGRFLPTSWAKQVKEEDWKDFEGLNYTFGVLYKPTERWSLGAVYHTKFTAEVTYTQTIKLQVSNLATPGATRAKRDQEYVFPSAFGLGVAYRFPNDKLTLALDITRREWDQFVIHDERNRSLSLQRRSGVSGLPKDMSPHDPTYTVRFGGEYVFVDDKRPIQNYLPSLRAGIFYDPEPASGLKDRWFGLGKGDGDPDDYYGLSLGAGVLIKNRVNLDLAYIYRWGRDVRKDTFRLWGADADVDQHTLYFSTVIYF